MRGQGEKTSKVRRKMINEGRSVYVPKTTASKLHRKPSESSRSIARTLIEKYADVAGAITVTGTLTPGNAIKKLSLAQVPATGG